MRGQLGPCHMTFCLCYSSNGEQSPRPGPWSQETPLDRQTACPRRGGKLLPSPFPGALKARGDQRLILLAVADLYLPARFSLFFNPSPPRILCRTHPSAYRGPHLSVLPGERGQAMHWGSPQLSPSTETLLRALGGGRALSTGTGSTRFIPARSSQPGWVLQPCDLGELGSSVSQPAQEQEPPEASKELPAPRQPPWERVPRRQGAQLPSFLPCNVD